eukprot:gene11985-18504_t
MLRKIKGDTTLLAQEKLLGATRTKRQITHLQEQLKTAKENEQRAILEKHELEKKLFNCEDDTIRSIKIRILKDMQGLSLQPQLEELRRKNGGIPDMSTVCCSCFMQFSYNRSTIETVKEDKLRHRCELLAEMNNLLKAETEVLHAFLDQQGRTVQQLDLAPASSESLEAQQQGASQPSTSTAPSPSLKKTLVGENPRLQQLRRGVSGRLAVFKLSLEKLRKAVINLVADSNRNTLRVPLVLEQWLVDCCGGVSFGSSGVISVAVTNFVAGSISLLEAAPHAKEYLPDVTFDDYQDGLENESNPLFSSLQRIGRCWAVLMRKFDDITAGALRLDVNGATSADLRRLVKEVQRIIQFDFMSAKTSRMYHKMTQTVVIKSEPKPHHTPAVQQLQHECDQARRLTERASSPFVAPRFGEEESVPPPPRPAKSKAAKRKAPAAAQSHASSQTFLVFGSAPSPTTPHSPPMPLFPGYAPEECAAPALEKIEPQDHGQDAVQGATPHKTRFEEYLETRKLTTKVADVQQTGEEPELGAAEKLSMTETCGIYQGAGCALGEHGCPAQHASTHSVAAVQVTEDWQWRDSWNAAVADVRSRAGSGAPKYVIDTPVQPIDVHHDLMAQARHFFVGGRVRILDAGSVKSIIDNSFFLHWDAIYERMCGMVGTVTSVVGLKSHGLLRVRTVRGISSLPSTAVALLSEEEFRSDGIGHLVSEIEFLKSDLNSKQLALDISLGKLCPRREELTPSEDAATSSFFLSGTPYLAPTMLTETSVQTDPLLSCDVDLSAISQLLSRQPRPPDTAKYKLPDVHTNVYRPLMCLGRGKRNVYGEQKMSSPLNEKKRSADEISDSDDRASKRRRFDMSSLLDVVPSASPLNAGPAPFCENTARSLFLTYHYLCPKVQGNLPKEDLNTEYISGDGLLALENDLGWHEYGNAGVTAFFFLLSTNSMASDLVKNLQQNGQEVPADLANGHRTQLKASAKKTVSQLKFGFVFQYHGEKAQATSKVDEADERFEDQHLEFLELQNRLDDSDGEKAQLVEKIQSLTELMQEVRDDATKVEASNKELRIANDELKAANDAAAEEIIEQVKLRRKPLS